MAHFTVIGWNQAGVDLVLIQPVLLYYYLDHMNLGYGLALQFCVAQVDRAPARCLGGHRFESCRGLRFFLCPTLVTCWSFHFHINHKCPYANHYFQSSIISITKRRRFVSKQGQPQSHVHSKARVPSPQLYNDLFYPFKDFSAWSNTEESSWKIYCLGTAH